jgi:hypothetical protein
MGRWESKVTISFYSHYEAVSREVRFIYYEHDSSDNLIQHALTIGMCNNGTAQLIISVLGFPYSEHGKGIYSKFNFSELDRKSILVEERRVVIERLVSEGLLVKQGEFFLFGKRCELIEKQEVINETAI